MLLKLRICERPPYGDRVLIECEISRLTVQGRAGNINDTGKREKSRLDLRYADNQPCLFAPRRVELEIVGVKSALNVREALGQVPARGESQGRRDIDRSTCRADNRNLMVDRGKADTIAAILRRVDGRLHSIDKGIGRRLVVASRDNELDRSGTFPRTVGLAPADAGQCLGNFDILPAIEAVGLILKTVEVAQSQGLSRFFVFTVDNDTRRREVYQRGSEDCRP